MQIGYSFLINTSKCLQQLKIKQQSVFVLLFILLNILSSKRHHVDSSLLIGAIFTTDGATVFPNGTANTNLFEPDEEIVFKHAVYISNQNKFGSNGIGSNGAAAAIPASAAAAAAAMALGNSYTTLLHKIIHVTQTDQLKTIKKICQETSGNLLALIGPHEESLKMYSRSLAEQLDLIHFDLDAAIEPSYSFNLYPATDVMCQAFADLIKRFEWRNLAIIYHSKTNLKKVKCLLSGPGKSVPKLDITLRIVNFEYEFRIILRDLSRRSIRNIILDLEPEESQVVLKMALQLGMINSSYHFIMTSLDVETINLDDFKYNRANLTALRIIKSDSAFYKTIALNLTDYYSNNLINNNDKNKILLNTKNALMFDAVYLFATAIKAAERSIRGLESGNVSCQEDKILDIGAQLSMLVENVNLRGLTGSISFRNKQRREFELDVLQLKESGLFKCGSWSSQHGLNFTFYDELFDDDMLSYKKNTFRVVTLVPRIEQTLKLTIVTKLEEPYVMEKDGKLEGFCIDILNEIAQKMNFRYEIYKVPDNQYGNEDENGTWNGMIRELIDKKADMAISALTINFKRQQAVDFTKPFLNLGISILYKVPRSKKPGLFSFLNPLSLEIWICTLITYILISLIMMILARFSPYEWRNKHPCNLNNEYVENQFTVWNSLWFAMGTLMQQGSDINPKALSTRLVGGVWWFFTLIIISSYTANLAAFLTVEKFDISITNVEQLANQTKVAYGVFKGGSTMNFFKESKIDTYRRMWRYMDNNPHAAFVSSNAEGIKRVHERDFAYLMESPLIDYEIQKNCSLTQVGGLLDTKGYGIATQLGSPYTDDISLQILEMQEKGTIQKFYNQWWKAGSTCGQNEKKDTKPDPLKVENVGGIFVVLIGGLFLACVVSLFEFLYYAKQNSKKIHKPLCSQMFDDLRFAIKCGGSAKKVQLSGSTAIPLKKLKSQMQMPKTTIRRSFSEASGLERALLNQQQIHVQQQHQASLLVNPSSSEAANVTRSGSARSVSGGGANKTAGGRDCRKCKDIIRNELLDQITPENAIVCKHDSTTNVSIHNPGLLIVDKDTAFDAHAALINSHILPPANHPHMHISHQSADTSFNGGLCHSIASSSLKKSPVKGVSGTKHIDSQSNLIENNNEYFMIQNANNTSNYRPGPQQSQPSHPHTHHAQHQHYQNNRNNSQQQELEIPINRYSTTSGAGGGNNMSAASTNIGAVDFFLAGGGGGSSQQHQHQQHHSSHPYPHPHSHSSSLSPPSSSSSHQQQQQQQQNELKNRTDGKFYAPTKSSKINTNRYI